MVLNALIIENDKNSTVLYKIFQPSQKIFLPKIIQRKIETLLCCLTLKIFTNDQVRFRAQTGPQQQMEKVTILAPKPTMFCIKKYHIQETKHLSTDAPIP